MMLMYKYLSSPISFDKNNIKTLVIENPDLLRKTVSCLYSDNIDELFVISENYKPLTFTQNARFIGDVLNFNFADKKLLSRINSDLENIGNTYFYDEISSVKERILSLCCNLSEKMEFDVDFKDNIETSALIKMCSFSVRDDSSDGVDKLLRFFKLMHNYVGIKCFIVQNLFLYYPEKRLEELFDSLAEFDICVVDIEHSVPERAPKNIDLIIIDNDLCVVDK